MLNNQTRFVIEDENAIDEDNFVNKIFKTTTVNNTKKSKDLGKDLKDNYDSIQSKKPEKILRSIKGVSGKEYELDRHDLLEVLESLFDEDSTIFKALSGVVSAIDAAEMAVLNAIIKASNVLDKATTAICNLAALLLGLTLVLPLLRLLDALMGLVLIAASKCQYLIYAMLMNAIDSDILKKMLSIRLIHGAIDYNEPALLTEILNHPVARDLVKDAPWIPGMVVSELPADTRSNKGGKLEFVPIPAPNWFDDLYDGLGNVDGGHTKGPVGTPGVRSYTTGPFWELSPLKYSPAYIAYARQYRTKLTVTQTLADPEPNTAMQMANIHALTFDDNPKPTPTYR